MSIEMSLVSSATSFVCKMNSGGDCPKVAKSMFRSAMDVLDNIRYEQDQKGAVQRALSQLESAYSIIHDQNERFFGKSYFDLQNELCYNIAILHKALGNSSTRIKMWILDKTTSSGSFYFADKHDFIRLIGASDYENKLSIKIKYYKDSFKRQDEAEDILRSIGGRIS
jgi:hypothetical protein